MEPAVKDIMTTHVVSVTKDASFRTMAAALRDHRVSAFPVLDDDGKVIGVVSEADMLAKAALDSEPQGMPGMITGILRRREQEKARGTTAGDLMTSPPITISPDDTLERAARLMYTRKVKRLPVVDANGHLVGIIGRSDLLAVFDRPDGAIRQEILDQVIRHDLRTDPAPFIVVVKDGIVTLEGVAETKEFGHEIVQQVRHVQGVVAVRDRLTYPHRAETSDARFDVIARFPVD
jgi:CBS-domain-containing membrane protein